MNPFRRTPNPHVLEIAARPWVRRLTPAGTTPSLDAVPDAALDVIAGRGFHGVWLMGAWTSGPEALRLALETPEMRAVYDRVLPGWTEADVVGSPYSIQAYEPGPDVGGREALTRFRGRLRERDLGLMLDFVPNHLGCDHPWTDSHPERLVTGTAEDLAREPSSWFEHVAAEGARRVFAHGRDPNFAGWTDTVQVDHRRAETRQAMTRLLRDLAAQCDGLRCDVAMLLLPDVLRRTWGSLDGEPPGDFWTEAIAELRASGNDVVLLAEAYWGREADLLRAGFDFAYDKGFYDDLLAGDAEAARARLASAHDVAHGAHFVENHDEQCALATFGEERLTAALVATFGLPGLRLFHEGQDEGRRVRLPVQLARAPDEPVLAWCRERHEKLWRVLRDPVFHEGSWTSAEIRPPADGEAVGPLVGSVWQRDHEVALLVANVTADRARARVPLPVPADGATWTLEDQLSGDRFERDRRELLEHGLFVELGPWGTHVLRTLGPPS